MLFSSVTPYAFLALSVLYLAYKYIIYPSLLSPLSKIPAAHPIAPFSDLWILWKRYKYEELSAIHDAHQRLGPIVRLGPKEVSVNCIEGGIRTVYSGGFEKGTWYENVFTNYGFLNMFTMKGSKEHSAQKRTVSNIYAKSTLQASPAVAQSTGIMVCQRMLNYLSSAVASNRGVDIWQLMTAVTMDNVTSELFGMSIGTNFIERPDECRHFLDLYHSRHAYIFHAQELPGLTNALKAIGIRLVPEFVESANAELEAQCLDRCNRSLNLLLTEDREKIEPINYPNVYAQLTKSLGTQQANSKLHVSQEQQLAIGSELLDHLAAGFDTSTITLTYLFWELSQRPSLQESLRSELRSLDPPIKEISDPTKIPELNHKAIDSLELLHAVVMETLRLHPAIPGPQPRVTPAGGCTLGSFPNIPEGVRVSAQAYSLHRNAEVFPEPESWKPERWMNTSSEKSKEMGRWFWAFGSGGRMCVGSNLAMLQMKAIVAAIYSNFSTSIVDDEGIEQEMAYTARPKRQRLILEFVPVD
ncbi:MAG: hypothetical protein M1820_004369 [Bogoriella megaspora]|nr:MAG: hypothetical protein M1820_004369 [Bogoriella megaspora]